MSGAQFMSAFIIIMAVSQAAFLYTAWIDKKRGIPVRPSDYSLMGTVRQALRERLEMEKARKRRKAAGRKPGA